MNLTDYWRSLSEDERQAYAKACGTTSAYVRTHLIPTARKVPRPALARALAEQSCGRVSYRDVFEHFYDVDLSSGSAAGSPEYQPPEKPAGAGTDASPASPSSPGAGEPAPGELRRAG